MSTASPWDNILRQLTPKPGGLNLSQPHYNPRPAGLIRASSAICKVLEVFQTNRRCWLRQSNVQWLTRLDGRQTDWALHYLHSIGIIEQFMGDERGTPSAKFRLFAGGSQDVAANVAWQKPMIRGDGQPRAPFEQPH